MITDFGKKQKRGYKKNDFMVFAVFVAVLGILCSLVYANIKIYKKRQFLSLQLENLKNQIENLKKNNRNLEEGISKSQDREYIEKIAREQLDLQKSDERVVSFIMPKSQEEKSQAQNQQNNWLGWLGNFWHKIFGK